MSSHVTAVMQWEYLDMKREAVSVVTDRCRY